MNGSSSTTKSISSWLAFNHACSNQSKRLMISTGNLKTDTTSRYLSLIIPLYSTYLVPYVYINGPDEPFPFPQFPVPDRVVLASASSLGWDLQNVLVHSNRLSRRLTDSQSVEKDCRRYATPLRQYTASRLCGSPTTRAVFSQPFFHYRSQWQHPFDQSIGLSTSCSYDATISNG